MGRLIFLAFLFLFLGCASQIANVPPGRTLSSERCVKIKLGSYLNFVGKDSVVGAATQEIRSTYGDFSCTFISEKKNDRTIKPETVITGTYSLYRANNFLFWSPTEELQISCTTSSEFQKDRKNFCLTK